MSVYSVIITAGGIGKRMESEIPKQFLPVKEKPILMHTLEKFYHVDPTVQLLLTLPEIWIEYWEALLIDYDFKIPHRVISGGKERYHSIQNALNYCYGDYVAVHDGVRPLVSPETIRRCFDGAKKHGAVVPVLKINESLRKVTDSGTKAVDRNTYLIVQTPQCFKKSILEEAYKQPFHKKITDDASLVEEMGVKIYTEEGNFENIKITSQPDLIYSELFLK